MSHHIVELKDAFFKYPDGTEALKGVSFKILHGESVGIAGANGMGKTTLLLNLSGHLIPIQAVQDDNCILYLVNNKIYKI